MEYKRKRLIRAALQKAEAKRKQTVRQAESAAGTEQQTSEEYAQTVVSEKTAHAAENLQNKVLDTGRISYRQFRILQEKRLRVPTTHAASPYFFRPRISSKSLLWPRWTPSKKPNAMTFSFMDKVTLQRNS